MIKPWTRLRSHRVHDYKILKVREDIVLDPRNQTEHARVVIESSDWVNVVALTRENKIILIRQFRTGTASECLEVPGGIIEAGESPDHAAARELEEETGYRSNNLSSLGSCHPNPAIQNNRCYTFLATECTKVSDGQPDDGEDIEVELRSSPEVFQLIREGKITHALALNALLSYAFFVPSKRSG